MKLFILALVLISGCSTPATADQVKEQLSLLPAPQADQIRREISPAVRNDVCFGAQQIKIGHYSFDENDPNGLFSLYENDGNGYFEKIVRLRKIYSPPGAVLCECSFDGNENERINLGN